MVNKTSKGEETFEIELGRLVTVTIPVASLLHGKYKLTYTYKLEKLK